MLWFDLSLRTQGCSAFGRKLLPRHFSHQRLIDLPTQRISRNSVRFEHSGSVTHYALKIRTQMMHHLVLLPGLLCSHRVFKALTPLRHRTGLRVRVPATHSHDSIEDLAKSVLTSAPARFAVCGFSFGGYVALEILRQAPARLTGVALISSQAAPDSTSTRQRREDQIAVVQRGIEGGDDAAQSSVEEVIAQQLPLLLHRRHLEAKSKLTDATDGLDESFQLIDTLRDMAFEVGAAGFVQQQRAIMSRGDRRPELFAAAGRGLPIAIIAGKQDMLIPPAVPTQLARALIRDEGQRPVQDLRTTQRIRVDGDAQLEGAAAAAELAGPQRLSPCVQLTMLDDCGHMAPLEQPDAVGMALCRWLDTVPRELA